MRFRQSQRLLACLTKHLNAETEDFEMPTQYFLRGRRRKTLQELGSGKSKTYLISKNEERFANNPETLIAYAIHVALKRLDFPALKKAERRKIKKSIRECSPDPQSLKLLEWKTIAPHGYLLIAKRYVSLYDIGFLNLLANSLTSEALHLVRDSLGYHSIIGNWNAAVALPWFVADFGDQEWKVPIDGFSDMISRLCGELRRNAGRIKTGSKLVHIMKVHRKDNYKWKLTFRNEGGKTICFANHVVLALPRRALEKLTVEKANWARVSFYLPSVKAHNLFKLFLVYKKPWWKRKEKKIRYLIDDSGRVVTDQPLRQVYYYGPDWIKKRNSKAAKQTNKAGWSFIMASYSDAHYPEFWSPFLSTRWRDSEKPYFIEPSDWHTMNRRDKARIRKINRQEGVHWRMVNKIHRQLAQLHRVPVKTLPKPILGIFMNWESEPHCGGWHTWEVSARPWIVINELLDRIPGLYVCGEAYSDEQGWIEGALNTAEQLLVRKFKLSKPSWFEGDDFKEYVFRASPETQ